MANVFHRLMPESSPIARGAEHAAKQPCSDSMCRAEIEGRNHRCEELATDTSCTDVSAYWHAMGLRREIDMRLAQAPDNRLLQGERLARERNCFRCHGELGQGGITNAGALKNYIPGHFGRDFSSLTSDGRKEVVAEWISTGSSRALTGHPVTGFIAQFFLNRQAVSMPNFSSLPAHEIELLTEYVIALNAMGALEVAGVANYAAMTVLPDVEELD